MEVRLMVLNVSYRPPYQGRMDIDDSSGTYLLLHWEECSAWECSAENWGKWG